MSCARDRPGFPGVDVVADDPDRIATGFAKTRLEDVYGSREERRLTRPAACLLLTLLAHTRGWWQSRPPQSDAVRACGAQARGGNDPGLITRSRGPVRTHVRHASGTSSQGACCSGNRSQLLRRESPSRRAVPPGVQWLVRGAGNRTGHGVRAVYRPGARRHPEQEV